MKPVKTCAWIAALMVSALSVTPTHATDQDGRWSIGVKGGLYKLVLSDHTDAWTPGWLINGDVKYGLTSKWSVGAEGSWMQTKLADLTEGSKMEDGAGASFTSIEDGPKNKGIIAGLFGEYHFIEDAKWSPFFTIGTGMYFWKWVDDAGNTLLSNDPALDVDGGGLSLTPDEDLGGNPYELKDQELYAMAGLGVEYFASDLISFELGVKFRYLTHVLSDFTDEKDIVGSDPGQLDLPKGIAEGALGLTFHFGASCPDASAVATASPTSGAVPFDVQYEASVTGGCPEYTYLWDFGDGTTSTERNPRHTYDREGAYTASLTVTDSKGTPAVSSVALTATCPPVNATASGTPLSGQAPLIVTFEGTATGGCAPVAYVWEFGDGGTSTEQNPSHEFPAEGNYTATLTVTDAKGAKSESKVLVAVAPSFVPTPEKPVVLEGVLFQTNKAVLLPESEQILDRVAESLIAHPEVKIEVGGHSDADGSDAYNKKLSQRRADAVKTYLVKKGVPAANLTAKGYGEAQPIADNKSPEGKAKNRRVELKAM